MSLSHAHQEPDGPKNVLRFYGFAQPWRVRFWPLVLVVIVVVIYLGTLLAVELADALGQAPPTPGTSGAAATAKGPPKATTVATAVLALGAFVVGYHQWRAARRETSMERFYDRLEIANRRLAALDGVDPFHMYVFAELDNLEYVIEIEIAERECPDVVLMDLRMPVLDGFTATSLIRRIESICRVPVIAVSAQCTDDFISAAARVGCDHFVPKPVDFDLLLKVIRELTEGGARAFATPPNAVTIRQPCV